MSTRRCCALSMVCARSAWHGTRLYSSCWLITPEHLWNPTLHRSRATGLVSSESGVTSAAACSTDRDAGCYARPNLAGFFWRHSLLRRVTVTVTVTASVTSRGRVCRRVSTRRTRGVVVWMAMGNGKWRGCRTPAVCVPDISSALASAASVTVDPAKHFRDFQTITPLHCIWPSPEGHLSSYARRRTLPIPQPSILADNPPDCIAHDRLCHGARPQHAPSVAHPIALSFQRHLPQPVPLGFSQHGLFSPLASSYGRDECRHPERRNAPVVLG
jgi:hypothetical protein